MNKDIFKKAQALNDEQYALKSFNGSMAYSRQVTLNMDAITPARKLELTEFIDAMVRDSEIEFSDLGCEYDD